MQARERPTRARGRGQERGPRRSQGRGQGRGQGRAAKGAATQVQVLPRLIFHFLLQILFLRCNKLMEISSTVPSKNFFPRGGTKNGKMITVRKGRKIPVLEEKKEKNRVLWKNTVTHLFHINRIYGRSVAGDAAAAAAAQPERPPAATVAPPPPAGRVTPRSPRGPR